MSTPEEQLEAQLSNIEGKTGQPRARLFAWLLSQEGLKHMALVQLAKAELGLGHGDANALVHSARRSAAPTPAADPADAWFTGKKAGLRPLYDAVMAEVAELGEHAQAPRKAYMSLRRRTQFATVGPGTNTLLEVGFNRKGATADGQVEALKPGKMCTHRRRIASVDEVDAELVAWLRRAWEEAG